MAHTRTAARQKSPSPTKTEPGRRLSLVPVSSGAPEADVEHLEIAYGGGWESFDSDDIDALWASGPEDESGSGSQVLRSCRSPPGDRD